MERRGSRSCSSRLTADERERYAALARAMRSIIDLQTHGAHRHAARHRGAGRQPRTAVLDVPAPAGRAQHDPHACSADGEDDEVLEQRRRALERQAQRRERAGRSPAQPRGPDRDPRPAHRAARRSREEARLHRRGARADRGAGGADPRAGGAVDRSRDPVAADRRDRRDARRHRPVDPRSAEGLRRDGRSADRAAAADASMRARRRASERAATLGGGDAGPVPIGLRRAVPDPRQRLRRRAARRTAAVAAGVSRRGDVRDLRRRAALRPQPRRARDPRRRGLGRLARPGARPRREPAVAAARAGLRAGADRPLPAADAEPEGCSAARSRRSQPPADQARTRSGSP